MTLRPRPTAVKRVRPGFRAEVRGRARHVSESGQEQHEDGGRICLSVWPGNELTIDLLRKMVRAAGLEPATPTV